MIPCVQSGTLKCFHYINSAQREWDSNPRFSGSKGQCNCPLCHPASKLKPRLSVVVTRYRGPVAFTSTSEAILWLGRQVSNLLPLGSEPSVPPVELLPNFKLALQARFELASPKLTVSRSAEVELP